MLLTYVDESYTKGKSWYYIAALLVPDNQAVSLTHALDHVVSRAAASYRVSIEAELHGHEVFHGKAHWAVIPREMVRARIGIYSETFQAIADHDVKIILRGLAVEQLKRRYRLPLDPHRVVLAHTLERVNDFARVNHDFALVIADELDSAAQHRADLSTYHALGSGSSRASTLPRIVDTLHFAPSHASRLVQAADMVAYLYCRMERHPVGDPRSVRANEGLWARIEKRIIHKECWYPFP